MKDRMCRYLKRFEESGGMETSGILTEDCIDCHTYRSGIDIFCPDYSSPSSISSVKLDWHERMHERGYK